MRTFQSWQVRVFVFTAFSMGIVMGAVYEKWMAEQEVQGRIAHALTYAVDSGLLYVNPFWKEKIHIDASCCSADCE